MRGELACIPLHLPTKSDTQNLNENESLREIGICVAIADLCTGLVFIVGILCVYVIATANIRKKTIC